MATTARGLTLGWVCQSCCRTVLRSRKSLSSPRPTRRTFQTTSKQQNGRVGTFLPSRGLIYISGEDAARWLQGLMTTNITPQIQKKGGFGHYSAFLNAAGRVLHDVFIYPTVGSRTWHENAGSEKDDSEGGFLIEADAEQVQDLARHLKRYKLRAKVGIRLVDREEWRIWTSWKAEAESSGSLQDRMIAPKMIEYVDGEISSPDNRAPGLGHRRILFHNQDPIDESTTTHASPADYFHRRMILGVPEGQIEIEKASALPQQYNLDYMGGIDFRKGCYVGQELTIRTHHTGVVRRRVLPIRLFESSSSAIQDSKITQQVQQEKPSSGLSLPPPGTSITRVDPSPSTTTTTATTSRGSSAGKFLTGVGDVGLALCRLEAMFDMANPDETPRGDSQGEWTMKWDGGSLRTETSIPPWHHDRHEAQRVRRGGPNG